MKYTIPMKDLSIIAEVAPDFFFHHRNSKKLCFVRTSYSSLVFSKSWNTNEYVFYWYLKSHNMVLHTIQRQI
jgi:hypothetical protein